MKPAVLLLSRRKEEGAAANGPGDSIQLKATTPFKIRFQHEAAIKLHHSVHIAIYYCNCNLLCLVDIRHSFLHVYAFWLVVSYVLIILFECSLDLFFFISRRPKLLRKI